MNKFRIYATTGATVYLGEFEALTKDAAIELAQSILDEKYLTLCHHCAEEIDLGEFYINDSDVELLNVREKL